MINIERVNTTKLVKNVIKIEVWYTTRLEIDAFWQNGVTNYTNIIWDGLIKAEPKICEFCPKDVLLHSKMLYWELVSEL